MAEKKKRKANLSLRGFKPQKSQIGWYLGGLGVRSLTVLVGAALGETNAVQAEVVSIAGLNVSMGLNKSVPLAYERANRKWVKNVR